MIRLVGTVTYTGGREEPIECGQIEFAAWERYALRAGLPVQAELAPPVTMLRFLGYAAVNRGKPQADWPLTFEEWGAEVEDVALEAPEEAANVPPTRLARLGE